MIEAYMQIDFNNELAVRYHHHALKSFEPVADIFHINVVQCITPDTIPKDFVFSKTKGRSPQEEASLYSQYRMHKRIAQGERLWIMEHDAYLFPDRVDVFRMITSKYKSSPACNIGVAMECYTAHPAVSKLFCDYVENDSAHKIKGPMSILHTVTDKYCKNNKRRNVYWPKHGQKNETGVSRTVSESFRNPILTLPAAVTQLIDTNSGNTVTDREKQKDGSFINYTKKTHPNFHFISLDSTVEQ